MAVARFTAVLAGGGVRGGVVHGASDYDRLLRALDARNAGFRRGKRGVA